MVSGDQCLKKIKQKQFKTKFHCYEVHLASRIWYESKHKSSNQEEGLRVQPTTEVLLKMPPRVLLSASSPLVTLWQISHLTKYLFARQIFFCWHFFWMLWTVYALTNLAASTFYNTEANISTPNVFPLIIFWHTLCTLCLASCRPLWKDGVVDYLQKIKKSTFLEPVCPSQDLFPCKYCEQQEG